MLILISILLQCLMQFKQSEFSQGPNSYLGSFYVHHSLVFGRWNILFYDLGLNLLSRTSLMILSPAYKGPVLQIRHFNTFITCSGFNPETSTTTSYILSLRSTQQGFPCFQKSLLPVYRLVYIIQSYWSLNRQRRVWFYAPCKTSPGARSMTGYSSFSHSCHCEVNRPDGFGLCWVIEGCGSLLYWSIGFIRCRSALWS